METEGKNECIKYFAQTTYHGLKALEVLKSFLAENRNPLYERDEFKPTSFETVRILEKLMSKVKKANPQMTAADSAWNVYWYEAVSLPRKLTILRDDITDSSMIIYDLFMPFNNKDHDDTDCLTTEDLPIFYKNKK